MMILSNRTPLYFLFWLCGMHIFREEATMLLFFMSISIAPVVVSHPSAVVSTYPWSRLQMYINFVTIQLLIIKKSFVALIALKMLFAITAVHNSLVLVKCLRVVKYLGTMFTLDIIKRVFRPSMIAQKIFV